MPSAGQSGAGGAGTGGRVGAGNGGTSGGATGGSAADAGRGGSSGQGASAGRGGSEAAGQATGGGDLAGEAGVSTGGTSGGCSCDPGQYCRGGQCFECSDLSQLDFAAPEEILDHELRPLRFPRPADVAGSLLFTLGSDTGGELWYEASLDAPPGVPLGDDTTPGRSALFYFDDADHAGWNALFDEQDESGRRSLRTALFYEGALLMVENAPAPLTPGDYDDYSIALAPSTGRFYWMSTRDGAPALYTGLLGTTRVDPVEVGAQGSCVLTADAPWVSYNGTLLVVSAPALDATCAPLAGGATDLYAAPISSSTGQPAAAAIALAGLGGGDDASETDAAFSSDLCTLYFASDGGAREDFDFKLYRASRR